MNITEIVRQVLKTEGAAFFYTPPFYKDGLSYHFKKAAKIITSKKGSSLISAINRFESGISGSSMGYCLVNYEAGHQFEKKLMRYLPESGYCLFRGCISARKDINVYKPGEIEYDNSVGGYRIKNFKLATPKREYISDIKKIKSYISAGDTYQVNYTVEGNFRFEGDIAAFFIGLIRNQSAEYTAVINTGEGIIISLSPELFFRKKGRKIATRPMKGTIGRGINLHEDEKKFNELKYSTKDKAENVMIVDLLRNDLGRICEFGSVKTKEMFRIEKYETLYQMTSLVEGKLKGPGRLAEILKNIYPCGSITGAPKIRTMEIINEIENRSRGIYTGSIGLLSNNQAVFNVAIRTIELSASGNGKIGIGSGIVWDSSPEKEYSETLLKSEFLNSNSKDFSLFETLCYEDGKLRDFELHLERLKKSADHFLFLLDEKRLRLKVARSLRGLLPREKKRVKIILGKNGKTGIEVRDFPAVKNEIKVIVSEMKTNSSDASLYFKTTDRKLYDDEHAKYSAEGYFDVLFLNENNFITEGAISNIFVRKGDRWVTPPLNDGVLAGIERKNWLNGDSTVFESSLRPGDLLSADEIVLTNSLRGRTRVDKIYIGRNEFREF